MKTLYSILGVSSDATGEQIETAYAKSVSRLQNEAAELSAEEINNQRIATREAHATLTNPILRQRYDQKLSATDVNMTDYANARADGSVFGFKAILLVGVIVLAGVYMYTNNAKEREKLRIEHEHAVQMKAVQIAEDQQKQTAKMQDTILDKSAAYADGAQLRMSQQQFERESMQRQQIELQQRRLDMQEQQQLQQQEAARQRQEQQQRQQQLQSEKRLLQQMERDRYGKVITH